MSTAVVTIDLVVPSGYAPEDYAKLFANSGSGDIDWDNPANNRIYDLFPGGAGIYGFGRAPFGHFRFGHGHSMRAAGFGHLPFGKFPFGHGTGWIRITKELTDCGAYKYAFIAYDEHGNEHTGTPGEATISAHFAPDAPTGLKPVSYNKDTDVLVLEELQ